MTGRKKLFLWGRHCMYGMNMGFNVYIMLYC